MRMILVTYTLLLSRKQLRRMRYVIVVCQNTSNECAKV